MSKLKIISFFIRVFGFLERKVKSDFFSKITKIFKREKEEIIFDCIKKCFNKTDNDLIFNSRVKQNIIGDSVIWTAWFQGLENAPDLVKRCIGSFSKVKNKKVIILTKDNWKEYIHIPDIIVDRLNKGGMTYTSFSEVVRLQILSTYGGLWLDATVYIDKEIPEDLFSLNVLSLKGVKEFADGESTKLFPVYFMNVPYAYEPIKRIRDYLFSYWLLNKKSLDYFFVDYCLKLVYLENNEFSRDIKKIPIIGKDRFLMSDLFNKGYNEDDAAILRSNPVGVYKLSNKIFYATKTSFGENTFYHYFVNNDMNLPEELPPT